jgi:hypothetical protein
MLRVLCVLCVLCDVARDGHESQLKINSGVFTTAWKAFRGRQPGWRIMGMVMLLVGAEVAASDM